MSGTRHLFGDQLPVRVTVPDCVTVKPGDLMTFIDGTINANQLLNRGLGGKSGCTGYAYPMAAGITATTVVGATTFPFLGVALGGSPHGSTDTISVATAGVFEFPLITASATTLGRMIHSSLPTGFSASAQTTASYQVYISSQTMIAGTTIGYCVGNFGSGQKTAHTLIRSNWGPGGRITDL